MSSELVERWRAEAGPDSLGGPSKLAAALVSMVAVFALDIWSGPSIAAAVLYAVVLMIAAQALDGWRLKAFAAACVALTLLVFAMMSARPPKSAAEVGLVLSLSSILVTTALVLRNEADRAVLAAQARLIDLSSDAIVLRDHAGRVVYWNRGAEHLFGWTDAEARGRDLRGLLRTRFAAGGRAEAEAALAETGRWQGELAETDRSGRVVEVLSRWTLQHDRKGHPSTVMEVGIDICARKETEEALRASEERFRTIFDTLAIGIWEHDFRPVKEAIDELKAGGVADMRAYVEAHPEFVREARRKVLITDVNRTALRMMGVPSKEQFFTRLSDFLPEEDRSFAKFIVALDEGHPSFEQETVVRTMQGKFLHIIVALNFPPNGAGLDRIQGSILNITERVRMQEALDEARRERDHALRVATMGEVSASIAHEVNQPLAAISAYAEAARRWLDRQPPDITEARAVLGDVATAARHAAEVVKRVRQLLGKAKSEMAEFVADAAVRDAVQLMRREIARHSVRLDMRLGAPGATILGDSVLLQQAIVNLVTNAVQAMEEVPREDRRLRISTAVAGESIAIEVEDSGPGFGGDGMERAFAPFHTTKAHGMGLGLSMCRSIVSTHQGEIGVAAAPGGGALVRITLPRHVRGA